MKITVAIPTIAGRSRYLEACLKTCISQEYEDLEILVSDNSHGEAAATVRAFRDARIRYIRPDRYLPMSQHWDFMIPHMTGELVTIIGDDDGLMPNALNSLADMISVYGLIPVQHSIAHYCWPDVADAWQRNTYWFHQPPGEEECVRRSSDYLRQLCRCETRYIDGPMVYHNFVPRDVLARISRGNTVFHRSSPDIYTAVSVALNTTHYLSTQRVLSVAGEGAKSNGAQAREGGIEAARFRRDVDRVGERHHHRLHAVALATLDSIVEASIQYDLPNLREMAVSEAFYAEAVNECRSVRNARLRRQRLVGIAIDAAKLGILRSVLWALSRRAAVSVVKTARKWSSQARREVARGGARRMGEDVFDVYSATLWLDRTLAGKL